jgi:hypothetical protein
MRRATLVPWTLLLGVTFTLAACSDDPAGPDNSPLAGLDQALVRDSTGAAPTDPGAGPGVIRGTVLGESPPGAGNDSLETAPRIAGVRVAAYPILANPSASEPELGPEAASTTTGADGRFQLPVLASGDYAVTFDPPASSGYQGQWSWTTVGPQSGDFPWWVVLNED